MEAQWVTEDTEVGPEVQGQAARCEEGQGAAVAEEAGGAGADRTRPRVATLLYKYSDNSKHRIVFSSNKCFLYILETSYLFYL